MNEWMWMWCEHWEDDSVSEWMCECVCSCALHLWPTRVCVWVCGCACDAQTWAASWRLAGMSGDRQEQRLWLIVSVKI